MTALDDAVKAAMDETGCSAVKRGQGLPTPDIWLQCDLHGCLWDTDRDECMVVGSAVRAGWAAAIDAALAHMEYAASGAALASTGYGDEAYDRVVNAARIAYNNAHSAVRALRLPEGDQP